MKRLIVGDIHGRGDIVCSIYEKENPDEVILLGDYFDSHDGISTDKQIESFNKILALRDSHLSKGIGKFIMLLGNHDYHYLMPEREIRYSSYSQRTYEKAHPLLEKAIKDNIIIFAYIDEKNRTIYSHAGVTNYWLTKVVKTDNLYDISYGRLDLYSLDINFYQGVSNTGNTISNSPIWVRPMALLSDMYSDGKGEWTQIVGHTPLKEPFVNGVPFSVIEDNPDYEGDSPLYIIEGIDYYIVENIENDIVTNRICKKRVV